MKRTILIFAVLCLSAWTCLAASGTKGRHGSDGLATPEDSLLYCNEYLDTVNLKRKLILNDYKMIGVNAGVTFSRMSFNPPKPQSVLYNPYYWSVMFTHYGKMFGYLPYFGYSIGLAHGYEGFDTKENKETQTYTAIDVMIDGQRYPASRVRMEVYEIPFLAEFHVDTRYIKLMADAGIYGGYRKSITREHFLDEVPESFLHSFTEYEHQFDYGLQGGLGFALVLDPVEIQFRGSLRYSWSNIYEPDYYNAYYYRFAYPFDIMATVGLHFHFGKRYGNTPKMLKKEAYNRVYHPEEFEK